MCRSTIAAESARLRAASSVEPSGVTARSRGHDCGFVLVGGKFCGGDGPGAGRPVGIACGSDAPDGGGIGMTPVRCAWPVRASNEKTCTTSPFTPGVPDGASSPKCELDGVHCLLPHGFAVPDTYAVLSSGAIAMPPSVPGIGITWTMRPTWRARTTRQWWP